MDAPILRPTFSENQILSADDVNTVVAHARNRGARHDRYLHAWGIAYGLTLVGEDRVDGNGPYQDVTLTPGLAIDGHGREIVVTDSSVLSTDTFDQLNVVDNGNDPEVHYYPVFLVGRDEDAPPPDIALSPCDSGGPARVKETFDVTFGRIGDAANPDDQRGIEVGTPIKDAPQSRWRILLGFVSWTGTKFAATKPDHDGRSRRYVGVHAEDVSGLGDSVTLRSAKRTVQDKAALVIDNTNGGEMRFGLHDSNGKVVPVLTVNAQGDVTAEGKIVGAIAGGVQIESGIITDGVEVPFPAGIDQAMIDKGEASIQITVQPRYQQTAALPVLPANHYWMMQPIECFAEVRRVRCLVRWEATDGSGVFFAPGVCDYVVRGFVKAESES
ncbi:MAG: hypothetical protein ACR2RL_25220 [Gammaproteobacteria bacterium]